MKKSILSQPANVILCHAREVLFSLFMCLICQFAQAGKPGGGSLIESENAVLAGSVTTLTTSGSPVCSNVLLTITATVTSGATGNVTFYNGATILGTAALNGSSIATLAVNLTGGAHTLTAVYAGDVNYTSSTSNPFTQNITATPPTPGVITGNAIACPSTSGLLYSVSPVAGATSYVWTFPAGWSGAGTTNSVSVNTAAGAASGNILVAALNGTCSSASSNTVNIVPVVGADNTGFTDGVTKSSGDITVVNAVPAPNVARVGYVKFPLSSLASVPAGAIFTSVLKLTHIAPFTSTNNLVNALGLTDPVTAAPGALYSAATTGTNYATSNWTTTNPLSITLNAQANLDIPASISSPGFIAVGLVRPATGTTTHTFYGFSAATPPVLTVTYTSLRSFAVSVTPTPSAPAITGPAGVCGNSSGNAFSITSPVAGVTYNWTVPAGWTFTGAGTPAITVTSNGTGGNITVSATNTCGTSPLTTKLLTISPTPTVAATPASQERCSGVAIGTITLSNPNAIPGTTYTWSRNTIAGVTGLENGTTAPITGSITNTNATAQTVTFTINAVANGCTSITPATVSVTVNPLPIANAGANVGICTGGTAVLGGSPTASGGTGTYTYLWTGGTVSSTSIANPTTTAIGTYTVNVTDSKFCVASSSIVVSTAAVSTKTWIGAGSGIFATGTNWNDPALWSPVGVPGPCNDVVMNIEIIKVFDFSPSGNIIVNVNADVVIRSLIIQLTGNSILSSTGSFRVNVGSRNFTVLNATTINSNVSPFLSFGDPGRAYMQVGAGGVINYNGVLTTSVSNSNTVYPFYANTLNNGTIYVRSNATLNGVGNDPTNRPQRVVFDGTGTQTITHNSGSQAIYLGGTSTDIGETNSPTVNLAGGGAGGFRTAGNLNILNTSTLNLNTQTLNRSTSGGTLSMSAGSTMLVGGTTGGTTGSNFPSNFSSFGLNATSTVNYTAAAQSIYNIPTYGHLTLSGSGAKTALNNTTAQSNISIQGSAVLTPGNYIITLGGNWSNYNQTGLAEATSTVIFNGTGAQSISTTGGEIFYRLFKTGAGITTQLSDVGVEGGGTSLFSQSAGTYDAGTFRFYSLNMPLTMTGGLLRLARVPAPTVYLPEFENGAYTLSGGSTIELYGNGNQVLRGSRNFQNLTFSTSGIKTTSSAISVISGTILTQNSVTLDVAQLQMGGSGTSLTMTGTSIYKTGGTGGTGTKPDAQGTYTLGTGTTVEFTNTAASGSDVRLTLPTYYNVIVSGIAVTATSAGTGIKFQTGGSFTVKNGGHFRLANSTGFSGGIATAVSNTNNPAVILEDGSRVEYYGGAGGTNPQTITNVIPYYHLNFSGTSIKTAPSGTLTVRGDVTNAGSGFAHNNGTLLLPGTVAQNYNSTGTILNWNNVTITNAVNVNVNGDGGIVGLLSLGTTGKLNLAAGNVIMRSALTGTASVDKITVPNSITYGGTGRFVVERYIPTGVNHGKSWQLLATPTFGQTVNAAWQEGNVPLANANAGFGTTLTSEKAGAVSRGFDFQTTTTGPSIKTYNSSTGNWDGIDDGATPTAALQIANNKGYMVFVRGDRSVQASSTPANATILRTTGRLYAPGANPPASSPVPAGKFSSVGNPYASAIDFTSLLTTSTGLDTKYYLWDPLLSGAEGYGGFQVLSSVTLWKPTPGGTANFPSNTPYTKIQSGQAFFVYSTPGGAVNFTENNKTAGSQMVLRQANPADRQFFNTHLYDLADNVIDGNTIAFDEGFADGFDSEDALKMTGSAANIAIRNIDKILSVDARKPIASADTVFYTLSGLRAQAYKLKLTGINLDAAALTAVLWDRFTNTSVPVDLIGNSTLFDFLVTSDPASYAADRFYIVFKSAGPLPVKTMNLTAKRVPSGKVDLLWKSAGETIATRFEIERSEDGTHFAPINNSFVAATGVSTTEYQHEDKTAPQSQIFYRIKAVETSGVRYSNIARVQAEIAPGGISVVPNPVRDQVAHVYFKNQQHGTYTLQFFDLKGAVVNTKAVQVSGNNDVVHVTLNRGIVTGSYRLRVIAHGGAVVNLPVIIE